jgi:hypothetical protein
MLYLQRLEKDEGKKNFFQSGSSSDVALLLLIKPKTPSGCHSTERAVRAR